MGESGGDLRFSEPRPRVRRIVEGVRWLAASEGAQQRAGRERRSAASVRACADHAEDRVSTPGSGLAQGVGREGWCGSSGEWSPARQYRADRFQQEWKEPRLSRRLLQRFLLVQPERIVRDAFLRHFAADHRLAHRLRSQCREPGLAIGEEAIEIVGA